MARPTVGNLKDGCCVCDHVKVTSTRIKWFLFGGVKHKAC